MHLKQSMNCSWMLGRLFKTSLIALSLLFSNSSWSQSFKLTDATFRTEDKLITYDIVFEYGNSNFLQNSTLFLDSIFTFLNIHPQLRIEISCHSDGRASQNYSTNITIKRANSLKSYLVNKGIESNRIIANGYRGSQLLISNSEIEKLKNNEEKEEAHQKNRRVQIMILNYGFRRNFKLSDSTYQEGDVLIKESSLFLNHSESSVKERKSFLDSLVRFCLSNPTITIEIGSHRDSIDPCYAYIDFEILKSKAIKKYLVENDVPEKQLILAEYGGFRPIISNSEIEKIKTQEEKEKAHQKNRRIEITILKMD
ncbi:MAG: outer membrane protein OmpA-like peptidoglycan-associated protein [Flavobacteriales bacterium]|jgi:outer membrane protein OmpA-like peptidoglycan-associated protein